jgi:hypothetical protein
MLVNPQPTSIEKNYSRLFLQNFFHQMRMDRVDNFFKNKILSILKKKSKHFASLTIQDRQLGLKIYELDRSMEKIITLERAPVIFPIERMFDSSLYTIKNRVYKSVGVNFRWSDYTILVKGSFRNLKLIFFLGSLY